MAEQRKRAEPVIVEVRPPYDAEAAHDAARALRELLRRYGAGEDEHGLHIQPPVGR